MVDQQANGVVKELLASQSAYDAADISSLSMEQINRLMILHKLESVKNEFLQKGSELKTRQEKVRWIHDLMQRINKRVDRETGELNLSHPKIDEATGELKHGAEIDPSDPKDVDLKGILTLRKKLKEASHDRGYEVSHRGHYTKEERERTMETLKMLCDDLNLQNDMQLQDLTQKVNERYEIYQMARAILKPLHDDKLNKARSASGR